MWYEGTRRAGSTLGRLLYRPRIDGLERVPAIGPVILASNHLSIIDSFVIPFLVPRRVRFLAKAEYFEGTGVKGRLSRELFTTLGAVPVKRDGGRGAVAALESGLKVLAEGEAFGIHPEGTRSRDGRLYRGRTGVAHLALTSGAPVVPVALAGTQAILPVGARVPRIRPVGIRFGEPLDFSTGYGHLRDGQARRVATDEVMAAIHALSGQERAGEYNKHADGH